MKVESPFYRHCVEALKNSTLFSGLDESSLRDLLAISRRETWSKGAHLSPKQATNRFTVIVSGRMELTRINPGTGRQITLSTLAPGDAFDVITLLDGKEHDIDPVALEPLEIVTAPLADLRRWIQKNPAFNRAFLPYLGERVRALENLSADLALCETDTRLARLIVQQAKPDSHPAPANAHRSPRVNTLSDEAMARMIGSVRVVVNRHLQGFVQMGLITKARGQLVVRDLEQLRQYPARVLAPRQISIASR